MFNPNVRFPIKGRRAVELVVMSAAAFLAQPSLAATDIAGPSGTCGGSCTILQGAGTLSGSNLFHSFTRFSIGSGDMVTFAANPATTINNVFSRVTGGVRSVIEGKLSLEAGAGSRNFFVINPAGITFGAGAVIDVPGAFHASTADYIKFPDGNFYADPALASTFSSAPPEAFGFLGVNRGTIDLAGTVLTTPPGTGEGALDLVAGDIAIDGGSWGDGISNTTGDVRLVAVGSQAAEIPVSLTGGIPGINGTLTINNGAIVETIATPTSPGGNITLAAGQIAIDGAVVMTTTDGDLPAGNMSIVTGSLNITGWSDVGSLADTWSSATGHAGDVTVTASGNVLVDDSYLRTDTYGGGNGGALTLTAANLRVDNAAWVSSDSWGTGAGGSVVVNVAGLTTVSNDSWISADVYGAGHGGTASVTTGSLLIDGGTGEAGISSEVLWGSSGNGGTVNVVVNGDAQLVSGGRISTKTEGDGSAGSVSVSAQNLTIDGMGYSPTGIFSTAQSGSIGDAGAAMVSVAGNLVVRNAGAVTSDTYSVGNAGGVRIDAGTLTVDSDSYVSSDSLGSGAGGSVAVNVAGLTTVSNFSWISADAYDAGHGGSVSVTTGSLLIDGGTGEAGISSETLAFSTGNGGTVGVAVSGDARIVYGGRISTKTEGAGSAGTVSVSAQNLTIDGMGYSPTGIFSTAESGSLGNAGSAVVDVAGNLIIKNSGSIVSDTYSIGNAGGVRINAGTLTVDSGSYVSSDSLGSGAGGSVAVNVAGLTTVSNDSWISADVYGAGHGGSVSVTTGSLLIDGGTGEAGISSETLAGSSGNGGTVSVAVNGDARIVYGGRISTQTEGVGSAGTVSVSAQNLTIDGMGYSPTGIFSTAEWSSAGNAGTATVSVAGNLAVRNSGAITSDTYSVGNAGGVRINAGTLTVDSGSYISSDSLGSGAGGSVAVNVAGLTTVSNNSWIAADAYDAGHGGSVSVTTGSLLIDGGAGLAGITSEALAGSTGNGGTVSVAVGGDARLVSGGQISSKTAGAGSAGSVGVSAGNLLLSGRSVSGEASSIAASATALSSGQTGSVTVNVSGATTLQNGAEISIRNDATVASPSSLSPTTLTLTSPNITLIDSAITAAATGNVSASNIVVNFSDTLYLDPSQITTSAVDGNGGSIFINGGRLLWLDNSQITTSVTGLAGNGGDIHITADNLVMTTGFIQANTAAANATGGNIVLNIGALIPSGGLLYVGGDTPYIFQPYIFGYNVIQAAAPDGVSGAIEISSPTVDLSGSLAGINARVLDSGGLGRNPCRTGGGSSLGIVGRGSLPPPTGGPLRATAADPGPALLPTGAQERSFKLASLGCGIL